jgi:hypothetical protein
MSQNKKPAEEKKGEKTKKPRLTVKQKKFVDAITDPKNNSATEAALKAGYSPTSARESASENLTKSYITEAIEKRKMRYLAHCDVTREEILGHAGFQMRSSIEDMIDEEGYFDLDKARETGAIDLVKEMEIETSIDLSTMERRVRHKVKFESSAAARKELANYMGIAKNAENPGFSIEISIREVLNVINILPSMREEAKLNDFIRMIALKRSQPVEAIREGVLRQLNAGVIDE